MFDDTLNAAQIFNQYRVLLFSIAYRMLGSSADAEDIVQDAFVRWLEVGDKNIEAPKAYLTTIIVRMCIDQLRSARVKRDQYIGPWLPEPLSTARIPELADTAIMAESLSFAFLTMLEKLVPLERAVFLLREVFDYSYEEIAAMVNKSEANCRQILHRAHTHLEQKRQRFTVPREQQEHILNQFIHASLNGDIEALLSMFTDTAIFIADTGGKVKGARKVIQGSDKVARGMLGFLRWLPPNLHTVIEEINGQLAVVSYQDEHPFGIVLLDNDGKQIHTVYTILNPDKMRWLNLQFRSD